MPNRDIHLAKFLVKTYGKDSLSYFSLHEKKKYFFSSTGQSFIAYTILNKVVLVSGDPIGPKEDIQTLLTEFRYYIKGMGLTVCFLGMHANNLSLFSNTHFKKIHIGEEAVLNLESFEKLSFKKKLRRVERSMMNQSIICKIYTSKTLPNVYRSQLETISQEWLQQKGKKEQGFSMTLGRIPKKPDDDCSFVLAIQNDTVLGYLTFVPMYGIAGVSLDFSRRRHDAPNGLTEFLLIQAFDYFKTQKITHVSLNFAPFYGQAISFSLRPFTLLKKILYAGLSRWYQTNNLYTFNQKFRPQWEGRYLVFERKRYMPLYLLAIAKTELAL